MPHAVLGLARREFLPTQGPQVEQITVLDRRRQAWRLELEQCHRDLELRALPADHEARGASIGDAFTEATQLWVSAHFPLGPTDQEKQELIVCWIQILCIDWGQNNPEWDNWLAFVFLAWGTHWLPDVIAEFLDGEAEQIVDDLYAQLVTELPRYQVLTRISYLESALNHCVDLPPAPHRCPTDAFTTQ